MMTTLDIAEQTHFDSGTEWHVDRNFNKRSNEQFCLKLTSE